MKVERSIGRMWGLALIVVVLLAALVPAVTATAAAPWPDHRLAPEHWTTDVASVADRGGGIHLAARRVGTDAGVRYLRRVGDTWVEEGVSEDRMARNLAIALGPDGVPVIAWIHPPDKIRVATRGVTRWSVERVAAARVELGGLALAIDGDGHQHLA